MIESINHMSFTVSDLEISVEFYRDILGMKLLDISERDGDFSEQVTGIKNARLKIAYLGTKNCALELVQYLSPRGNKIDTKTCNTGSAHICFNVTEFEKMVHNLQINNVKFAGVPCIISGGPNKGKSVLYLEDPDSNTIELISC